MARDFDRQVADLQIRAFAGSLGPVAFSRSLHEPLHGHWNAANSARGMSPFKERENSTSSCFVPQSREKLKGIKIIVPHPVEQQKIGDALSAVDAKIQAVADQVTKLETFKKGLLQQMFV